jgi:hypothetical protein
MKRAATLLVVALVAASANAAAPEVLVSFHQTAAGNVDRDLQYTPDATALREELRRFVIARAAPYLADGAGRRTLSDPDFRLDHPEAQLSRDPLRYEKPLVAQWLAVELAPAGRTGSAP